MLAAGRLWLAVVDRNLMVNHSTHKEQMLDKIKLRLDRPPTDRYQNRP